MKYHKRRKLIEWLSVAIIPVFCAAISFGAIFSLAETEYVFAYKTIDADKLITNIYNERTGKFYYDNVNAIAVAAGFNDLETLIDEASQAPHDSSWAFTGSSKFEEGTSVSFGTYDFNGQTYELNWIPVYLSNDKNGNAVLTLWLSNVEDSNGVVSNQEVATFTDGTYDGSTTHTFNDKTVVANTYSSSYIHNYVLNGKTSYDGGYGTINETEEVKNYWENLPSRETFTKFSAFAEGGVVSSYIIAPEDVPWQMSLSSYGNDPLYKSSNSQYYNNDWTKDKVWLPSMSEANRRDNEGLWKLTNAMCGYNGSTDTGTGYWWTRSARVGRDGGWGLNNEGWYYDWRYIGKWTSRVRPAIHLNLSLVADNVEYLHVHNFGDWQIIPATCVSDGVRERVCLAEGCTLPDGKETEIIPATGEHNWCKWEHNDDALNHTRSCRNCTETQTEPHIFPESWITDAEATEEAEGSKHRDCTVCGYRQTEIIPQLDHTHKYENWTEEVPATCTESGVKGHFSCTCGLYFDKNHNQIIDLAIVSNGHTEVVDEAVHATCTEKGKTAGKHCSVCNTVIIAQTDTEALGHDWADWYTTKAATETEEGEEKRECFRNSCGATETRPVAKLSHVHVFEDGWTSDENNHWHASACGHDVTDGTAAHGWNDGVITMEANCTEAGEKTFTCTTCGTTKTEEIPALGHEYAWVITLMPTEESEGLKENLCSLCGDKDSEEVIAKLVVDDNGGIVDLPPDKEYDLAIAVKESDVTYNIAGISKGYVVELFVVDGENKTPYDAEKTVTLMLIIPEGMENEFTLYKRSGDILEPVAKDTYTVDGRTLTIKTKLTAEFVFNAPAPETPSKAVIHWWIWLLVGLGGAAVIGIVVIIVVVIVIVKNKNSGSISANADNGEVLGRLDKQDEKIDRLIEITDGGFNDIYDSK